MNYDLGDLVRQSKTFARLERWGTHYRAFGKRGGSRARGTDSWPTPEEALNQLLSWERDGVALGDYYARKP